jgi:phenylalanyl-tRNA synthetase beta subunit
LFWSQYYLANDQKLKKYVPLIKDSLVYPVIYDADKTLLSLPPIINGSHTAVSSSSSSSSSRGRGKQRSQL